MNVFEQLVVSSFILVNFVILLAGYKNIKSKKAFTVTIPLFPFGIFVWADAIVISSFWMLTSAVSLILSDWYLFLLTISLFWLFRSLWDAIYWINEQFAHTKRNNPKYLLGTPFFTGEEVYILYQVFWQCMSVVFALTAIYLAFLWLSNMVK